MKKIDIHSHIFNLHFLPVAGAIRGISMNFLPKGLPVPFCKAVAWFYLRKMKNGFVDGTKSLANFQNSNQSFNELFDDNSLSDFELEFDNLTEEKEFYEFIKQEAGDIVLGEMDIDPKELATAGLEESDTINEILDKKTTQKSLLAVPWGFILKIIVKFIGKLVYKRYLKNPLDWFSFMTKSHISITRELFREYPEIDVFVHHDMDMDDWYELAPPEYSYDEQVELVSELIEEYNGKLIAFYAYNPKVGIEKLEEAILGTKLEDGNRGSTKGYKGVKFYPPSGYKPWYDDQDNTYQINNLALYNLCESNNVPIFTHCNYGGMQASNDTWLNNDVKHWSKVMSNFPDLKLCFGHGGGDEGWLGEFDNEKLMQLGHDSFEKSFPGQIYKLCITYPNVYCGFGFIPEVMRSDERQAFYERIVSSVENSQTADFPFNTKMMYGTDWHMLMQEHAYEDYYSSFVKLFKRKKLKEYKDVFFGGNAANYLGI
jgi:predicted TIM-barrel fold metal-dependent hydrolase